MLTKAKYRWKNLLTFLLAPFPLSCRFMKVFVNVCNPRKAELQILWYFCSYGDDNNDDDDDDNDDDGCS